MSRSNSKFLMVALLGCVGDGSERVGLLYVCNLALCFHMDWNLISRLQVLKSGSNKQLNWRLTFPVCVLRTRGTLRSCSGEWHKIIPTLDLLDHLLWDF